MNMTDDKDIPERVARLEAISEQFDTRMTTVENTIKELNNHISDIGSRLTKLETSFNDLKSDLEESNRRSMWKIGLLVGSSLTIINIIIGLIIKFL